MKELLTNAKYAIGACFIPFLMAGCIDGENPFKKDRTDVEPVNEPISYVSIFQVSPGVDNAEVIVDGKAINAEPLNYGQKARYLRVVSGNTSLRLHLSGKEVAEQTVDLLQEGQYSIFLVGGTAPSMMVVSAGQEAVTEGTTRIRFLNLSPDAPEVNLVEDGTEKVIFKGISFKETSEAIELLVQSSSDFTIRSTADNSILMQVPAKRLYAGWTYTIVLRGYRSQLAQQSMRLATDFISESRDVTEEPN